MAHSNHLRANGQGPRTPAPAGGAAGFGLGLLFVHAVLSPLLFSSGTLGAFEFPKLMLLTLTAIFLAAVGAGALVRLSAPFAKAAQSPSPRVALWRKPLLLGF